MREKLIIYSLYFQGDYFKIANALKRSLDYKTLRVDKLQKNVKVVTIVDKEYPEQLKRLDKPPYVLYCKGDIKLLNSACCSVIGSRKNSEYGRDVCNIVINSIVNDYTVVSGMAYGIDSIAHSQTLKKQGQTIAVLGSGFNYIYPKNNTQLALEIAKHGLIVSEYPPDVKPARHQFPMRNRIIAGLSSVLFVCEAAKNSGTRITADMALEIGNEVYCAPGSIFDSNYEGNHDLINEGATIIQLKK